MASDDGVTRDATQARRGDATGVVAGERIDRSGTDPSLDEIDSRIVALLAAVEGLPHDVTLGASSLGSRLREGLERLHAYLERLEPEGPIPGRDSTRSFIRDSDRSTATGPSIEADTTAERGPRADADGVWSGDPAGVAVAARRIGRFTILGELGSGGFGIVYLAHDPTLGRQVALKLPRREILVSHELKRRFLDEARVTARLDHPNIVPIYDVGELDAGSGAWAIYIASAYCREGSLARWIERQGSAISPAMTARLMMGLAEGVQYLHDLGILHRDLKPSNVLLQRLSGGSDSNPAVPATDPAEGLPAVGAATGPDPPSRQEPEFVPRVADFGLARLRDQPSEQTVSGAPIGSPSYMSPEQAQGKIRSLGPATDVYGLGAILYVLLCGRPPFRGETAGETIRQVIQNEPIPPRRLRKSVPRDLETICLTCLKKEPARRYASARALGDDLGRFLRREPIRARPISTTERVVRWACRRPATAALVCALATAMIAGGSGILWQWWEAVAAREELQTALVISERNETQARRNLDLSERNSYIANMNLAGRSWEDANIAQVMRLLEETKPQSSRPDLRGFEWYFLDRLCHGGEITLNGHEGAVNGVAYSPDGRTLASVGVDRTIKLWDVADGHFRRTLAQTERSQNAIEWAPDGKVLATGGPDGVVRIWDISNGRLLATPSGHAGRILDLVFSPDGKRLISSSKDAKIIIWDAERSNLLRTLTGHKGSVFGVAISRDARILASAGQDGTIKLWSTADGQLLNQWISHPESARQLAFHPDGKSLASAGGDGVVKLWDIGSRSLLRSHQVRIGVVDGLTFSPDGKYLAWAGVDQIVTLCDAAVGQIVRTFRGHSSSILDLRFSRDGKQLASAGNDSTIKLWDPDRGQENHSIPGHSGPISQLEYDSDGKRLASAGQDGAIKIWDVESERLSQELVGHRGRVWSVAFSRDGKTLASACDDGMILLWDLASSRSTRALQGHTGPVRRVMFDLDGKFLASAGRDRIVRIWDLTTGRVTRELEGHQGDVFDLAFSPDGKWLVSAGNDAVIRIWDRHRYDRQPYLMRGHLSGIWAVSFSPTGRWLASGGFDQTIKLWNMADRTLARNLEGHRQTICDIVFTPDGTRLISAGFDQSVRFWDTSLGCEILSLPGPTGTVLTLAMSPGGNLLATGGEHGTIKLWQSYNSRSSGDSRRQQSFALQSAHP